jgi:hypothetical protein
MRSWSGPEVLHNVVRTTRRATTRGIRSRVLAPAQAAVALEPLGDLARFRGSPVADRSTVQLADADRRLLPVPQPSARPVGHRSQRIFDQGCERVAGEVLGDGGGGVEGVGRDPLLGSTLGQVE